MGVTILGTLKLRKGGAKVSDSERTRASAPAHDRASAWLQPSCLTHPTTAPCASVSMCEWYVFVCGGWVCRGDQTTASTRQVAASPAASWWNLSLISKPNYEGTRCFLLARFRVSDGEGRDYQRTGEGPVDRNGNLGFLEEKEFGRGV